MTEQQEVLKLSDPGDMLEAIPYLVGFRPRHSLVLLGLHGARVRVTLRMDLSDAMRPGALRDTAAVLGRADVSSVIAVVYWDPVAQLPLIAPDAGSYEEGEDLPAAHLAADVARVLERNAIQLLDALLVVEDQWWSYVGRAAGCACCEQARQLPGDTSPAAASAVFAGMVRLTDRDALADTLAPQPADQRARLTPLIRSCEDAGVQAAVDGRSLRERRSVKRALFTAAREADGALIARVTLTVTDAELARFAVGLSDVAVRDALWLAIDQRRLDGRPFWLDLLARLPSPYDCAPLFLFGWSSWRDGNGALAAMAAERALASNPDYTAADLLLQAARNGLDPFRTPRLRVR
jgi:hypothetical protein